MKTKISVSLVICLGVVGIMSIWSVWGQSQPSSPPSTLKYDFENGITGWKAQDYDDSQACTQVLQSDSNNVKAKEGKYSLKMMMDLVGGDAHKSKGEAWINWLKTPPSSEKVPANLNSRTITVWVYAPAGAKGEKNRPNGFQVFVKDSNWNGEYGKWYNASEGQWFKIALTVSSTEPDGGWKAEGFDPSKIIAIGIKMGAGGGSKAKYKGSVFIDAINW